MLFYADWPLYNYETGYELIYQENKAYNCSLAARVLDKVIIVPGETFSFWNAVRDANREVPYKKAIYYRMESSSCCLGAGCAK